MKCWQCETEARGVCRFCGRAVCKPHAQTMNYIVSVYPSQSKKVLKSLVVADAIFCGQWFAFSISEPRRRKGRKITVSLRTSL